MDQLETIEATFISMDSSDEEIDAYYFLVIYYVCDKLMSPEIKQELSNDFANMRIAFETIRKATNITKTLSLKFINEENPTYHTELAVFFLRCVPCGDWQTTSESLSEFQFEFLDIDGREDEVKGLLFDSVEFARNNLKEVRTWRTNKLT
jgi:hypothetical protein